MADTGNGGAAIRCTACGFENSPLIQYCQDCGARLDPAATVAVSAPASRPVGPPVVSLSQPRVPADPAPPPQAAVPKSAPLPKSKPRTRVEFPLATIIIVLLRTIFYGALAAVVIQLVRKPAAMPPPAPRLQPEVAETARRKLQENAETGKPVQAPWESVNSYLATVLQPGGDGSVKSVSFSRAAVAPNGDGFSLFTERKVLGLRLFSTISYRPVSRGGGTGLVATGAAVGRIPLPEWAAGLVESSLGGLDIALYSELENLRNARKVEIGPDAAVIQFASP